MANKEHFKNFSKGVEFWNKWREENPKITPDLQEVDLDNMNLDGINLSFADLRKVSLNKASLKYSNLRWADLRCAEMVEANFEGANLEKTTLWGANFYKTNLAKAKLNNSMLSGALFIKTNLENADISNSKVYGISAWDVNLTESNQKNLIISHPHENPTISVDNLEIAQFINILLYNDKISGLIDTLSQKAVLILGRFNKTERKNILDLIREELRLYNFIPILFDFDQPSSKDFSETIMTLAGMCCFIIADVTNPSSSPLELQATVPNYMIPFVPLLQKGEKPFSMFTGLKTKYDWVLDMLVYDSGENLIKGFKEAVLIPAVKKHQELIAKKTSGLTFRNINDYI